MTITVIILILIILLSFCKCDGKYSEHFTTPSIESITTLNEMKERCATALVDTARLTSEIARYEDRIKVLENKTKNISSTTDGILVTNTIELGNNIFMAPYPNKPNPIENKDKNRAIVVMARHDMIDPNKTYINYVDERGKWFSYIGIDSMFRYG